MLCSKWLKLGDSDHKLIRKVIREVMKPKKRRFSDFSSIHSYFFLQPEGFKSKAGLRPLIL